MNTSFLLLFRTPGIWEILIIAVIVLLLFGGKKIPELMKGLGKGIREFKDGVNTDEKKKSGNDTAEKKD
ncbi:MAG: twin-arginine translocase TatA/TatE family subunit [Bacteroidetes bacterium]|nr:twin-arginine translocase TatA/TatE family subunit [Bacteroidota bacterium]MBL7103765.1 twin-arginine translocase TatA/TatE family subunit [Bacteroidales bacterium]